MTDPAARMRDWHALTRLCAARLSTLPDREQSFLLNMLACPYHPSPEQARRLLSISGRIRMSAQR